MYTSLNINVPETKEYICGGKTAIENLSQINIFIGPNNSGKSKFMRALFSNDDPQYRVNDVDLDYVNDEIENLKKDIADFYSKNNIKSIGSIRIGQFKKIEFISANSREFNDLLDTLKEIQGTHIQTMFNIQPIIARNRYADGGAVSEYIRPLIGQCLDKISFLEKFDPRPFIRKNIYIPTLRGLRGNDYMDQDTSKIHGADTYAKRTKRDYFIGKENVQRNIYTGLSLFEDVKRHLLGHAEERKRIKDFENFISVTFFDGQDFTIIPHIDDNVVHVKIGDDDDFPIYRLGEGVQAIIILTYPLFFNQEEKLSIYYEEPDLFLHPGFQRIFLETISKKRFANFQFFMTTHSNHFLDMTLDFSSISVYTFKKASKDRFEIENVKNDDINILEILGVKNSSVFLSNCTIWVEGITDRIYIRKYLELYQQQEAKLKYSEDIHYSFVEYGGNNITHWSFLEDDDENHRNIKVDKLCSKLFLVADKDGATKNKAGEKSKKLLRQEQLQNKLQERFYLLESKEIENLISPQTLMETIKDIENKEDLSSIDFSHVDSAKYKNQSLGDYIDKKIPGLSKKYAAESGTIRDKVTFAKTAVGHMDSYKSLSDEAKLLTEKIFGFIQGNNPRV